MKDRLLMASVAGRGFLGGLGRGRVAARLWEAPPPTAPVPRWGPAPPADAGTESQPAAPEPAASDRQPDGREGGASLPAPTYEENAAARDRAAAHSARSR